MRSASELLALAAAGVFPVVAYLALGLWVLRALRAPARGAERLALAYVLGSGAASLGILALRSLDVPLPLPALAALAASALLLWRPSERPEARTDAAPPWTRAVDGASVAVGAVIFVAALGPEVAWDALEYHLPMVKAWSEGPIRALPAMLDAEFRAGVDLLFVPAVAAGQPDAAAAVSAGFALALAALVRAEARRRISQGAGAWAGLFVLLAPLTLDKAPTAEVDLAVGAYGFVALAQADRWNRTGAPVTLTLAALALAFAANAKLHAAVLVPAVGVLVTLGGRRPAAWSLAGRTGLVAALVAPWLVKSAWTTGNPFFPLLGDWFGWGPTTRAHLELRRWRLAYDLPVQRDPLGLLRYLGSLCLGRTPEIGGLLGPLPLALLPLGVRRLSRATAVLVGVLAVLLGLQFVFMPAARFGTPWLAFLALGAAAGGARLARSGAVARTVLAGGLLAVAVLQLGSLAAALGPRILALRDPAPYQRAALPDQEALRRLVEAAEPVVGITMGAVAWMPKPVYNLHWERNGELFFGRTPSDRALALLQRRGVRSLVLQLRSPLPTDGTVGHPTVDAWIRAGQAVRRTDREPLRARGDRVWVLVELR